MTCASWRLRCKRISRVFWPSCRRRCMPMPCCAFCPQTAPAFRQRHSLTRRSPDPGDAVSPSSPENAAVDHAPNPYSIRIDGYLGPTALSAFPDMVSQLKGGDTLLTGLLDRSALYGVLAEIEALGLDLVELRCLTPK